MKCVTLFCMSSYSCETFDQALVFVATEKTLSFFFVASDLSINMYFLFPPRMKHSPTAADEVNQPQVYLVASTKIGTYKLRRLRT